MNHRCASLQANRAVGGSGRWKPQAAVPCGPCSEDSAGRWLKFEAPRRLSMACKSGSAFWLCRSRTGRAGPCAATRRLCPGAAAPTPQASRPRAPAAPLLFEAARLLSERLCCSEVRTQRGPLQSSHPLRRERVHPLLDGRGGRAAGGGCNGTSFGTAP